VRALIIAACLLSLAGCTINVVDKRLSREEVAVAFRERDAVIAAIAKKLQELDTAKTKETKK
jgi:hypothetical protein